MSVYTAEGVRTFVVSDICSKSLYILPNNISYLAKLIPLKKTNNFFSSGELSDTGLFIGCESSKK